jgi:O-antigen/teichoic acid export membrane protein
MVSLATMKSTNGESEAAQVVNPPSEPPTGGLSRSALWVVIARGWSVAASATLSFMLPRWFGANREACGEVILLLSLVGIAAMLGSFGLPETMIRITAVKFGLQQWNSLRMVVLRSGQLLFWTTTITASLVAGYFWLHGFTWFHLPSSTLLAVVVGVTVLTLSWQMVAAGVLRGLQEVKWANLLSGGQSGGPIAVTAFLLMLAAAFLTLPHAAITSTLVAQLLMVAVTATCGLTFWRLWQALPALESLPELTESVPTVGGLALDALPIALSQVAAFCTLSADLWLVDKFFGTDDVALYGSAKRLVLLLGVPEQLAMLTIIGIIPSLFAKNQIVELQRVIRQAVSLAAIPAIVAAVALIVLPEQVLRLAFGAEYKGAAAVLVILTLGQLTANCLGPCGYVLLMTGRRWTVLAITLLCGVSAIVIGALAAYFGGLLGLAIASAFCTAAQITLEWLATRYFVGVWCHASPFLIQAAVQNADMTTPPKESPL